VSDRGAALVATLGLIPHPEGGYYGEVYRSASTVQPADGRDPRPALTTIYFLLPAGAVSRWHRVRSDEVWHFYEGAPLELWMTPPGIGEIGRKQLGPLQPGQEPIVTVPAGWWQAARSTGPYTLVGCTVAPGFDFRDFELAADHPDQAAALRAIAPAHCELI
jgi:uncharacterized protein